MLVSEPACCPFCVQPEFGITYEPPPFRRGLAYADQQSLASAASAMSSTSSLGSQGLTSPGRRRGASVAANDTTVITTDRVRPDWAKKLADARAHALRRAAAATALHNAAYMMGNLQTESRSFGLGRRRRTMFGNNESAGSSGHGTPRRESDANSPSAQATQSSSNRNESQADLTAGRQSSRRGNRIDDLEELMIMEAIRLSLAVEEERKKKEEKEAAKEAKKEEKKKAKEAKKADKAARRSGFFGASSQDGMEEEAAGRPSSAVGKGKAADRSGGFTGFGHTSEPASSGNASSSRDNPQSYLEQSRAQIQREVSNSGSAAPCDPSTEQSSHLPVEQQSHRSALRNLSAASSSASSLDSETAHEGREQSPDSSGVDRNTDEAWSRGTRGTEPMFNFDSLTEVITSDKDDNKAQHIEDVAQGTGTGSEVRQNEVTPTSSAIGDGSNVASKTAEEGPSTPQLPTLEPTSPLEESVATLRPASNDSSVEPASHVEAIPDDSNHLDSKHIGDIGVVPQQQQAAQ